ncbi:MAG: hypothetical protein K6E98_02305 [Lachnospiraceae bacterium]|nr:hypothetical protein [Lachnospiraceae bacterium]
MQEPYKFAGVLCFYGKQVLGKAVTDAGMNVEFAIVKSYTLNRTVITKQDRSLR